MILLRADFSRREIVDTGRMPWQASPLAGVDRKPLDRIGGEVARATSLVRYAAGSHFDPHEHLLGEEFLVLRGTFSDEWGDYCAGTYVRNPPGSSHRPFSRDGCEIFVKLRQFAPDDCQRVLVDGSSAAWLPGPVSGLSVLPLHQHGTERVALVRWAPGARFKAHCHWGGEEIMVLDGVFSDEYGDYPAGTWLRNPHRSTHVPFSEPGCLIWVKAGHLDCLPASS